MTTMSTDRVFTTAGIHPYDQVEWGTRDVVQRNWRTNEVVFEQRGVEFPVDWSDNAVAIVTSKYFRGALGTPQREHSLKQVVDRVIDTYVRAGQEHGYFDAEEADAFGDDLKYALITQMFSFNSPVWFNVGTASPQQVSACFILSVEDTMESILDWYREEGLIFKGGSGSGVNLSHIRSSKELLSSGGNASGPVSFMRGADASAGTIKSGGATRRAAKMVVLDVDHPDIGEFVATKAREEDKIRALREAGFDMDLGGEDIASVQYQNANNSVRVTDEFMRAAGAETGTDAARFGLRARLTGEVVDTVDAPTLFQSIAQAAWECADPGIQYSDTISRWHTNPETGPITASNPCSEYMSLDDSSCNLASLNLMKFLRDDGTFDVALFERTVELVITAMDISISFADFPTERIGATTRDFRQLGIGYSNLGALLMATGNGYDSDGGRALAGAITSLMTGVAYRRSAELAERVGPYNGFALNREAHLKVIGQHHDATAALPTVGALDDTVQLRAEEAWEGALRLGREHGYRNAQASVLAPTGTISFMMDCDTTGIEPDFSLVKFKKLASGDSMQIVNQTVPRALATLGYDEVDIERIIAHITEHGDVVDAPGLAPEHYAVFDTATGRRSISALGHVRMMAACQPFLSGAISKTVNLPEEATVADIAEVYRAGWELGLKALAVYRDNCKVGQPLSSGSGAKEPAAPTAADPAAEPAGGLFDPVALGLAGGDATAAGGPVRRRLPRRRPSQTTSFSVGGAEGYLTAGSYEDGGLGEIFLKFGKQGSTLAGVMDAFSIAVSIGLQYGVPLETFVEKFTNLRFEPAGMTDDPDIRMAQSIMDYVFRRLALDHLDFDTRSAAGIHTVAERTRHLETGSYAPAGGEDSEADLTSYAQSVPPAAATERETDEAAPEQGSTAPIGTHGVITPDAPICMTCGTPMQRAGSCFACSGCGATSGCS